MVIDLRLGHFHRYIAFNYDISAVDLSHSNFTLGEVLTSIIIDAHMASLANSRPTKEKIANNGIREKT